MVPTATKLSTYCFVAACRSAVGFCVSVTDVRPPKVKLDAPSEMAVVPIVTAEFVSDEFAMLDSVFAEPEIVLFVSVCEPVSVATVLSMLIVRAAEPSNVVPVFNCKPVLTVSAAVVLAVIVPEPPKDTVTPLYVTDELVRLALPMLLNVVLAPDIVLLVNVSEPDNVANVPEVGSVTLVTPVAVNVMA